MDNQQVDLFLDTYRRLETAAETLVGSGGRSSSVMRLAHLPEFSRYREELDYCRQVRNLLTHEAKIGGMYGVVPSQPLLDVLNKVLRQIEDPPTVGEYMTPVSRLLAANLQQKILPLMTAMDEQGISYLPVLEQGKILGIFSHRTLFHYLSEGGTLDETVTLEQIAGYLSVEKQRGFRFVPPTLPLEQGRELFRRVNAKHHRVKLLLVTKDGRPDRPLMGIVSPYDILKEE